MEQEYNSLDALDKTIEVFRRLQTYGPERYAAEIQKKKEDILISIKSSKSDPERARHIYSLKLICGAEAYLKKENLVTSNEENLLAKTGRIENPANLSDVKGKRKVYIALAAGAAVSIAYLLIRNKEGLEGLLEGIFR